MASGALMARRSHHWLASVLGAVSAVVLLVVLFQGTQLYTGYTIATQLLNPVQLQREVFRSFTQTHTTPSPIDRRSHFNELIRSTMEALESSHTSWEDEAVMSDDPLQICLVTADVPFSVGHGGTATAFLMLAELLTGLGPSRVNVTLVGLQRPEALLRQTANNTACNPTSTRRSGNIGHSLRLPTGR